VRKPPTETEGGSYHGKVGRGVLWSMTNSFVLRASQFAVGIITARLIAPKDFGVFAVALVVFTIIINVSEAGVGTTLIREPERTKEFAPTAVTIALVSAGVLAAIMVSTAHVTANWLGAPNAASSIMVLSLTVLLAGATATPSIQLTMQFRQKEQFLTDVASFVVANGTLVVLLLAHLGPLALAWSRVAGQVVILVMLQYLVHERYLPGFNRERARYLLRIGLPFAGANLVSYIISSVDFALIGRLSGPTRLGYYNLAFNISNWPSNVFSSAVNKVTLPILGRARHDRAELVTHLTSAASAVCACAFPVSAICAGLAHPLIEAVYGPRWTAAAPALYGLSVLGAATVISAIFIDALFALGRSYVLLTAQIISVILLIPGIYLGVRIDGISGAAWTNAIILGGVLLAMYVYAVHACGITVGWLPRVVALPLVGSAAAGVTAHLTATLVSNAALACLAGTAAALVVYVLICGLWLRKTATRLRQLYGKRVDQAAAEPDEAPDTGTDAAIGMTPA